MTWRQASRGTASSYTRALRLLDTAYPGDSMTVLARVTHDAISQDPSLTHTVLAAADAKLKESAPLRGKVTALDLLAAWSDQVGTASVGARSRTEKIARSIPPHLEAAVRSLRAHGRRRSWIPYPSAETPAAESASRRLSRLVTQLSSNPADAVRQTLGSVLKRLSNITDPIPVLAAPEVQEAVLDLLGTLDSVDWPDAAAIEQRLLHRRSRQPIRDEELADLIRRAASCA